MRHALAPPAGPADHALAPPARRSPSQTPRSPGPERIQLNFILAPSFHSTTLIARLLNNHPDLSCLGDTLPHRRAFRNQHCGCGRLVRECPFWRDIARELDADRFTECDHLLPSYPVLIGHRRLNAWSVRAACLAGAFLGPEAWRPFGSGGREFLETTLLFGERVRKLQNSLQFVDASKSLTRLLATASLLGERADVRILHLVRDPRGFHYSERKSRRFRATPRESIARWSAYHRGVERACGLLARQHAPETLRMRYEDLCEAPERALGDALALFGVSPRRLTGYSAYESKNHVLGNAARSQFDGEIVPSLRFKDELSAEVQRQILDATAPLSRKYGYA